MEIFAVNNKPNITKVQSKKPVSSTGKSISFQATAESIETTDIPSPESEPTSQILRLNAPNPFLVLNEIDNPAREKEILAKDGGLLLKALNDLRVGIINGEFTKNHLQTLKYLVDGSTYNFSTPELSQLINDIRLRASVELAKLEQNATDNSN